LGRARVGKGNHCKHSHLWLVDLEAEGLVGWGKGEEEEGEVEEAKGEEEGWG
jgi:hypothetical protein